jgi:hypothetical protein
MLVLLIRLEANSCHISQGQFPHARPSTPVRVHAHALQFAQPSLPSCAQIQVRLRGVNHCLAQHLFQKQVKLWLGRHGIKESEDR